MWQFFGDHLHWVLGIASAVIWLGAVLWYLVISGLIRDWYVAWRERRKQSRA